MFAMSDDVTDTTTPSIARVRGTRRRRDVDAMRRADDDDDDDGGHAHIARGARELGGARDGDACIRRASGAARSRRARGCAQVRAPRRGSIDGDDDDDDARAHWWRD